MRGDKNLMFVQKKQKICKLTIIFLAVWTTFLFTGCEAMDDDSDLESLESSSEINSASTVSPFSEANPSSQEEYLVVNTATGVCIKKYNGEEKGLVVPCEIEWTDPALEQILRLYLDKLNGPILHSDVWDIHAVYLRSQYLFLRMRSHRTAVCRMRVLYLAKNLCRRLPVQRIFGILIHCSC